MTVCGATTRYLTRFDAGYSPENKFTVDGSQQLLKRAAK
jgi:hypothetical protein